jgi:hypothetical protein
MLLRRAERIRQREWTAVRRDRGGNAAWIGVVGAVLGSLAAFAGTWWLQREDVEAEARGVARVVLLELEDRISVTERVAGARVQAGASMMACSRLLERHSAELSYALSRYRELGIGFTSGFAEYIRGVVRARCRGVFAPDGGFRGLPRERLRPIGWTRSERKLLASGLSADEWFDLIAAVRAWERLVDEDSPIAPGGVVPRRAAKDVELLRGMRLNLWPEGRPSREDKALADDVLTEYEEVRAIAVEVAGSAVLILFARGRDVLERHAQ